MRPPEERAITGELVDAEISVTSDGSVAALSTDVIETIDRTKRSSQSSVLFYIGLPAIFLTVTLLGGMRLGIENVFVFLKPSLFCLIAATILLILFFRAGLIVLDGWFSEDFPAAKNAANGSILLTLFAAATQLFNSLLPERGLPFWIVGFCFFWTLWNNLFADFDTKRLLRSLGALFGLAFIVKYILLAYISEPTGKSWIVSVLENPVQEATVALLDLPRFSAGTGYLQFFAVGLFLLGLFLLPARTNSGRA
ncbi:MAG: hypothetical protein ACR2IH_06640 [Pyrinomonadaceae bacterium]